VIPEKHNYFHQIRLLFVNGNDEERLEYEKVNHHAQMLKTKIRYENRKAGNTAIIELHRPKATVDDSTSVSDDAILYQDNHDVPKNQLP